VRRHRFIHSRGRPQGRRQHARSRLHPKRYGPRHLEGYRGRQRLRKTLLYAPRFPDLAAPWLATSHSDQYRIGFSSDRLGRRESRTANVRVPRRQFDLLPTAPAGPDSLRGLVVELSDLCRCGSALAVIGSSEAHLPSLHCRACNAHRGRISRSTHSFITEIINEFGRPTAPIKIRRSERTSENSESDPECAPAASPASD
jgi:hypothetical protein